MSIEEEARTEAYRRFTGDTIVDETTGETVPFDDYGYAETERKGFISGAVWASEQADREPSDAAVEAAGEAIWGRGWRVPKEVVRAALLAAQEVRNRGD